jgi:hypothetical protein
MQRITINGKYYTRVYGGTIAAPTWKRFMDRALEGQPKIGLQTGPPAGLGWYQNVVPEVRGLLEVEAQNAINDAGFFYAVDPVRVFDDTRPAGTVIVQSEDPGEILPPGATITYQVTIDTLPAWWFTWPASWDPCVPPADWWGTDESWPPDEWGPPTGWSGSGCGVPPDPDPSPSPTPSPEPS